MTTGRSGERLTAAERKKRAEAEAAAAARQRARDRAADDDAPRKAGSPRKDG